eukprot:260335-Chlamydomonas_euryale.AAC.1
MSPHPPSFHVPTSPKGSKSPHPPSFHFLPQLSSTLHPIDHTFTPVTPPFPAPGGDVGRRRRASACPAIHAPASAPQA